MEKNREDRRAWRPKEFALSHGLSLSKLYEEIGAGRIKARKFGACTIIFEDDNKGWRESLPMLEARCA